MIDGPWFITSSAIKNFMRLCGADTDNGRLFDEHAGYLRDLVRQAIADEKNPRRKFGDCLEAWQVRCKIFDKSPRLELVVSTKKRSEGYADQLIAVADKDDRRIK